MHDGEPARRHEAAGGERGQAELVGPALGGEAAAHRAECALRDRAVRAGRRWGGAPGAGGRATGSRTTCAPARRRSSASTGSSVVTTARRRTRRAAGTSASTCSGQRVGRGDRRRVARTGPRSVTATSTAVGSVHEPVAARRGVVVRVAEVAAVDEPPEAAVPVHAERAGAGSTTTATSPFGERHAASCRSPSRGSTRAAGSKRAPAEARDLGAWRAITLRILGWSRRTRTVASGRAASLAATSARTSSRRTLGRSKGPTRHGQDDLVVLLCDEDLLDPRVVVQPGALDEREHRRGRRRVEDELARGARCARRPPGSRLARRRRRRGRPRRCRLRSRAVAVRHDVAAVTHRAREVAERPLGQRRRRSRAPRRSGGAPRRRPRRRCTRRSSRAPRCG